MRRFLSAMLLLCFGGLSLQAAPMRLCLLEQEAPSPAQLHHLEARDCCQGCTPAIVALPTPEPGEDCCLDFETLPETTTPVVLELRAVPVRLLCFFETLVVAPPALADRENHPPHFSSPHPLTAAERLAALSIWTI